MILIRLSIVKTKIKNILNSLALLIEQLNSNNSTDELKVMLDEIRL